MGLNLIVYEIRESDTDFDSTRRDGDREFVSAGLEKKYLSIGHPRDGEILWRPKDIEKYIEWVMENIEEENRPRLLKVLNDMKENLSLYFYESW